ncbi:MAG TPA: T9SS type A sorting domain-containing protein [Flavobacteriales bacterium]|nr:T9SS type A sorting domain-containing protein [Flavobacteriales bacterium]
MNKLLQLIPFVLMSFQLAAQGYPVFGPEKKVTITGITFDVMEPFLSEDENVLFFNSLNSGGQTNLHYALRVNDTTFTYVDTLTGCYDTSSNHLDAVASLDSANHFYWVSLRNYTGTVYANLHHGNYAAGHVSGISPVYGDFNIPAFGWLIMDAAIDYSGNNLYYCNAYFDLISSSCGPGIPCEGILGVAQKINDSTFNKLPGSDAIFANINDTNYVVYAPQVTHDGLYIYYTRFQKGTGSTQLCVSYRTTTTGVFTSPHIIWENFPYVPEGTTVTDDNQKIYYHQKNGMLVYTMYMRYRTGTIGLNELNSHSAYNVYPNPVSNILHIETSSTNLSCRVFSTTGQLQLAFANQNTIDVSSLSPGLYLIKIDDKNSSLTKRFVKQ